MDLLAEVSPISQHSAGAGPGVAPAQVMGAFHLTKGIVGTGWLALPASISTIASAGLGEGALPLALCLLAAVGAAAAYSYRAVAGCAAETQADTFAAVFERRGAGSASLAASVVAANCLGGCVSLAMLLGDASVGLLAHAGLAAPPELQLPARGLCIAAVTLGALRPVCQSLDLKAMQWTSVLGVAATALTALVMAARWLDGSYTSPGAAFATSAAVAAAPEPAADVDIVRAVLVFLSLLTNSFIAHQSAPRLRRTVDEDSRGTPEAKAAAFDVVVGAGFGTSALLYCAIAGFGYLTFGAACAGNILDSYAASDPLAMVASAGLAACAFCSFPQMLLGLRDSLRSLSEPGSHGSDSEDGYLSPSALLFVVAVLASVFTDLTSVMAAQGAVLGVLIVFLLPALMVVGPRGVNAVPKGGGTAGGSAVPAGFKNEEAPTERASYQAGPV